MRAMPRRQLPPLEAPPLAMRGLAPLVLQIIVAATTARAEVFYANPGPGAAQSLCDCVTRAARPGDECRLHAGTYKVGPERCRVANLRGSEAQPIVIASAGDGPVIFDGTVAIEGPWSQDGEAAAMSAVTSAPSPGGQDILQLFIDGELQVEFL